MCRRGGRGWGAWDHGTGPRSLGRAVGPCRGRLRIPPAARSLELYEELFRPDAGGASSSVHSPRSKIPLYVFASSQAASVHRIAGFRHPLQQSSTRSAIRVMT